MQIRFGEVKGIEAIAEYIKQIPHGATRAGMRAIAEWIVGNGQRGLKQYQAYKYVPYRKAYGGFKSDKQRRFVMAAIRDGRIDPGVPHRTGRTQRGYAVMETNNGYKQNIVNAEPGAYYTRDDEGQARLNALAGWRKAAAVISTNIAGAIRHAEAAVTKFLKGG